MSTTRVPQDSDISVTACVRGAERYIVMYVAETRGQALRQLGEWASNPDLSFTWHDAAAMALKMREGGQDG